MTDKAKAKPPAKPAPAKKARKSAAKKPQAPDPVGLPEVELPLHVQLGLTPREAMFVDHYLTHYNATRAYRDADYTAKNDNVAAVEACRLLRKPKIAQYLAAKMKMMFERVEEEQDRLLMTYTLVAYGDPNELVEHRCESCRYCHGADHQYQLKPSEQDQRRIDWEKAVRDALTEGKEPPEWNELGGVGFDPRREPHPDCPECFGEGVPRVVMKDTRHLSPAAQAMYAGVKLTKDGLEMLLHSQEKARDTLAKIRKLYDDKAEVVLGVVPQEKLDSLYAEALANAMAGRERTLGRKIDAVQEGSK